MNPLLKVKHTALFCALFSAQLSAAESSPAKNWVFAADYQYRASDAVTVLSEDLADNVRSKITQGLKPDRADAQAAKVRVIPNWT
jgi:hypothetical protein